MECIEDNFEKGFVLYLYHFLICKVLYQVGLVERVGGGGLACVGKG